MNFLKTLTLLLVGVLAFASVAFARELTADDHAPVVNKSSAKCEVVAIGYSKVTNDEAIATAAADARAHICGKSGSKSKDDIAKATAKAFAIAVADASAKCESNGDASFYAKASAHAKAAADLWVEAYASAFASAGVCKECSAYATSFGYIKKHVFLEAMANAEVHLSAYTKQGGKPLVLHVADYMQEVEKVVATAFAKALAGAASYKKSDGCLAWVNAGGCIWTEGKGDECFECEAVAVSVGAIKEIDAVSKASAHAASWTCGDHTVAIATTKVTAKSIAKAAAIAISYIWAGCEHDGHGIACAAAGTRIKQTAKAVAVAYAELWAGAYNCKDSCHVNIDAVAVAVGDVLVKASTKAYDGLCVKGGSWSVSDLQVDIEKASLTAIAEALATAISLGDHTCIAGGYVDASTH